MVGEVIWVGIAVWNAMLGHYETGVLRASLVEDTADREIPAGQEEEILLGEYFVRVYDRLYITLWADGAVGQIVAREVVAGKALGDNVLLDLSASPSNPVKAVVYEPLFPYLDRASKLVLKNPGAATRHYRVAVHAEGKAVLVRPLGGGS